MQHQLDLNKLKDYGFSDCAKYLLAIGRVLSERKNRTRLGSDITSEIEKKNA